MPFWLRANDDIWYDDVRIVNSAEPGRPVALSRSGNGRKVKNVEKPGVLQDTATRAAEVVGSANHRKRIQHSPRALRTDQRS
jgi:hypothetical protein